MLEALFLVNSRGLKVKTKIFSEIEDYIGEIIEEETLDNFLMSIYSDLNIDFPDSLSLILFGSDIDLPDGVFGAYFVLNSDIYFILTNTEIIDKQKLVNLPEVKQFIEERQKKVKFYKGLVIADYSEKEGPIPTFNRSPLSQNKELPLLAVQGITVLGMGMDDIPKYHLAGPLPVPGNTNYSFLCYMYYRPAPDSPDPRISASGRPATLFLIIEPCENVEKEILDFTKTFLDQWIISTAANKKKLENKDLDQLNIDLQRIVLLAKDLLYLRTIRESEIRKMLQITASENVLLRHEVEELKAKLAKYE
ncbi:MAG: hypothetical protein ACXAC7_24205 [Candidatus Hodarchaeales archaeon]|jgi:hypothetical protein